MQKNWSHMRLILFEVAREKDNQKLLMGRLTKLQMIFRYQPHFFMFWSMEWDIVMPFLKPHWNFEKYLSMKVAICLNIFLKIKVASTNLKTDGKFSFWTEALNERWRTSEKTCSLFLSNFLLLYLILDMFLCDPDH